MGETILVKSGQRVPLDGKVLAGASAIDQAPITGESMPVERSRAMACMPAPSMAKAPWRSRRRRPPGTRRCPASSRWSRNRRRKKRRPSGVDVFAKYYTVMVLGLLVGVVPPLLFGAPWMDWIYRALVLLVIACPCALVISTR